MGFFSEILGATVKTVLTPIAVVADVVEVATGNEPNNTKNLVKSVVKDTSKAMDDLCDGEL